MPWRALWLPVFLLWAPLSGRTARLYSYAGAVSDVNTLFPLTDTLDQYFQCPPNTFCPTHWTVLLPIPLGNDELYIRAVGGAAKLIYEKLGFNYTTEQYKPYIWLNNNSAPGTLVNTGPAGNVTSSRWTEWVIDTPVLVSGTIWAGLQHVGGQGLIYPVFPTSAVIGTDFTETFPLGNNPALQSIGDPPLALYVDVLTKTPTMTMTMTPTSTVIPTFTPTPTMTQTDTQTVTDTSTVIPTATSTPTATRTGTRSVSLTSTPTRRYIYDRPLSIQDTDALREGWFGALPTLASPFTAAQRLAVSNAITARGGEQFAYSDGTVTYVSVQEGRSWNVAWTQSSSLTLSSVGANTTQLVTVCYDPSRFSSSLAPAGYGTPLLLCYVDRIATGGAAANGQALTFSFTEAASSASVSAAAYAAVTDVLALVGCSQSSNIVVCTVPHTSMVVALAGPFSPSPVPTSSPKPSASNDNLALLGLVVLIPVAAILGCVVYYWVRRHQRLSVLEYHGPGLQFVPQGGPSAPPTPMPGFASPPPDLPGFAPWGWGPGSVSGAPSVAPSVASSGYASPAPDLFPGTLTFSFPPTHPNYSYSYHLPPFV